jgi:hypothetical protein
VGLLGRVPVPPCLGSFRAGGVQRALGLSEPVVGGVERRLGALHRGLGARQPVLRRSQSAPQVVELPKCLTAAPCAVPHKTIIAGSWPGRPAAPR